jgi:hypothetical protein
MLLNANGASYVQLNHGKTVTWIWLRFVGSTEGALLSDPYELF